MFTFHFKSAWYIRLLPYRSFSPSATYVSHFQLSGQHRTFRHTRYLFSSWNIITYPHKKWNSRNYPLRWLWIMWITWINALHNYQWNSKNSRFSLFFPTFRHFQIYSYVNQKIHRVFNRILLKTLWIMWITYCPRSFSPTFTISPAPIVINRSPLTQFSRRNVSIASKLGK